MIKSNIDGTDSGDNRAPTQDTHWQQVTQRLYDLDRDDELTTAIVFAIADGEDISPKELKSPPLYETVDVGGIEQAFFGSNTDKGARRTTGSVEFRYTEYLVKVRSDGWIHVYESTEPEQV